MKRGGPLRRVTELKRAPMRESKVASSRRRKHRDRMDELRPLVLARAGYRCEWCGTTEQPGVPLEAHHRLMRSQGGPDSLENLVCLCGPNPGGCHGRTHSHPAEGYRVGLLIHAASGPPVRAWARGDFVAEG